MSKKIFSVVIFSIALAANIYSQLDNYSKHTALSGISEEWQLLTLPMEAYPHMQSDLSDVRVFGITTANDTVEAPYIIFRRDEQVKKVYVGHKQINKVKDSKGYYYTWIVDDPGILTEIYLDFDHKNFDWNIKLEGSANQEEWFTIVDDYRVLSIKTDKTDYSFSQVYFPAVQYKYYRMLVKSDKDPKLKTAKTIQEVKKEGKFNTIEIQRQDVIIDKDARQTVLEIELKHTAPLSELQLSVANDFDYYRPIKIQYLADSVKTERGYSYQYRTLQRGTLSSVDKQVYSLKNTMCRKLKVIVTDGDNQPLKYLDSDIKSSVYELAVRFTEPGQYFLAYGNERANKPSYDIQNFAKSIPTEMKLVELENTQERVVTEVAEKEPLIKSKTWLWLIMGVIIVLLGWFSLSMLSKSDGKHKSE